MLDELERAGGRRVSGVRGVAEIESYLRGTLSGDPPGGRRAAARDRTTARADGADSSRSRRPTRLPQLVEGFRTDYPEALPGFGPDGALRGEDSAIVSPAAWEARDAAAPTRWVVVDDADHYVPEEQPASSPPYRSDAARPRAVA